MTDLTDDASLRSNKNLTWVVYALYAASFVVGITGLAAIIMNYVQARRRGRHLPRISLQLADPHPSGSA